MVFNRLYNTCMRATQGDKQYCKQAVDTLVKLVRKRMVMYKDRHGVRHVVVLPADGEPFVEIGARQDRSLNVSIEGKKHVAFIKYVYDGQFKPVRASLSTRQHVYMLDIYMSPEDVMDEIFAWRGYYEQ